MRVVQDPTGNSVAEEAMQAFLVRPVMTGLLALIIAGLWNSQTSSRAGAPFMYQSSCSQGAGATISPAVIGAMIRRGVHC